MPDLLPTDSPWLWKKEFANPKRDCDHPLKNTWRKDCVPAGQIPPWYFHYPPQFRFATPYRFYLGEALWFFRKEAARLFPCETHPPLLKSIRQNPLQRSVAFPRYKNPESQDNATPKAPFPCFENPLEK